MLFLRSLIAALFLSGAAAHAEDLRIRCQDQLVQSYKAELCLYDPGPFEHFHISLKINGQQIFMLMDDYVENITIQHHVAPEPSLELPISKQGKKIISLRGGCPAISDPENGSELGRRCNFTIGDIPVIKDMVFMHEAPAAQS